MVKVKVILAISVLLLSGPVMAHHSFAMFDAQKSVELNGTVKEFKWTNPHCWIQVMVPAGDHPVEWSVQMGATASLYRGGWRPGTLKPGDKIAIVVHPMRDGSSAGLFVSARSADGRPLGGHT
jgi:Family of unknown function (DUF6152)